MLWLAAAYALVLVGSLAGPIPSEPIWTAAERAYLERTSHLTVCVDPADPPFDFIGEDGRHQGIAADVLAEVARIIDVPVRLVPSADWAETLDFARRGVCDLVSMLNETPARAGYLRFTRPYVTFENAIVTHRPAYHHGLASLAGRTLALPAGYRLVELIDSLHPDIQVIRVDDGDAALRAVSTGAAYATLVNQQRLVNHIQRLRLRNVHYAGDAQLADHYRIGVSRIADPLVVAILDKALAELPADRVSRIMERWYVVPVEPSVDMRLVLAAAGVALALIALLVLHIYHRNRYYHLLGRQNRDLERISGTDALTGTANRRALDARFDEEMERARRHERPLSVILFDVDQFKPINDRHGHQAGDRMLVELAAMAQTERRATDVLGRWGGDEFLIICSDTAEPEAALLADRLRRIVEAHPFALDLRLTLSCGVAERRDDDDRGALLHRADQALYRAKAAGGNRVETDRAAQPSGM